MNIAISENTIDLSEHHAIESVSGNHPETLMEVYREDVNIVVWKRHLPTGLQQTVKQLSAKRPDLRVIATLNAKTVKTDLSDALAVSDSAAYLFNG